MSSKAKRTRQFIVEKTAPIFNMKGYAGTSLNDITEATGLTKGSIYGNFANKEEVALAVFDYNLSRVSMAVALETKPDHTSRRKLLDYVRVYGNFLERPFPEGGCPLLNTAVEADDTNPELRNKASNALEKWKVSLQELIQEGVKAGEFQPSVNAERVALTIIATLEGTVMITKLTGKLNYRKAILQSLEKMIENL